MIKINMYDYICDMIEMYTPVKPLSSQVCLLFEKAIQRGVVVDNFFYDAATVWNDLHSADLKSIRVH